MINMISYAGTRGENLREMLNYAWKRTHDNQTCKDGSIDRDVKIITGNPFHMPDYVQEWFAKRRLRV